MYSTGFDHIPDELFPFIFKDLEFDDLSSSRLVCRRWRLLIDELLRWNELIFGLSRNGWYAGWPKKWFYTEKSIDENRIIITKRKKYESFFEKQSIDLKLFKNVKRIRIINYEYTQQIHSNYFTKFNQLEQLEIRVNSWENDVISNPNLKILRLHSSSNTLELNTPKLQVIWLEDFGNSKSIKFIYPLTIEYLKIESFVFFKFIHHFRQLSNLQTLDIELDVDFMDDDNKYYFNLSELLIFYPKLENLIVKLYFIIFTLYKTEMKLNELLRKKKELNSNALIQLNIFGSFYVLDSIEQINEIFHKHR